MKTRSIILFIFMFTSGILSGQIINVPGDQPTIQEGINAANNGDTVLVAEDTYYENIRFMGKAITVASHYILDGDTNHINNTIIDGSQPLNPDTAAVVMFLHGEDTTSILNGFTVTGGTGILNMTWQFRGGGGIYASASGAKIVNNKIMNNSVEYAINAGGAGLQFLFFSSGEKWAVVQNNIISHNHSIAHDYSAFGAGIWSSINIIIRDNIIEHNTCTNSNQITDGGGIEVESVAGVSEATAFIENNIIRYNVCSGNTSAQGAGFMSLSSSCILKNNEFTHNSAIAADGAVSGGGFYINDVDSGCLVQDNIVSYNTIEGTNAWGGGARIRMVGYLDIVDNEFCNNTINSYESAFGGGLVINRPSAITKITGNLINDNLMNNNDGYTYAGGCCLYKTDSVPLDFGNNLLENNNATHGGALFIWNSYNLNIFNNALTGNYATYDGGAMHFWHSSDDTKPERNLDFIHRKYNSSAPEKNKSTIHDLVVNNAFVGNEVGWRGGAIYTNLEDRTPVFLNNVFWGNIAHDEANDIYSELASLDLHISNCDIDPDEVRGVIKGNGNFTSDPQFEDDSCHISTTSPCMETGAISFDVDGITYYCPDHDIDGQVRPMNTKPEVGVDEQLMQWVYEPETGNGFGLRAAPNASSGLIHLRYSIFDFRFSIFEVYAVDGTKVKTLMQGIQQPGDYNRDFDISDLPDGLYFICLKAGKTVETAKVVLIK